MKRTTQFSAIIAAAAMSGLCAGTTARAGTADSAAGVQSRLTTSQQPAGVLAAGRAANLDADTKASCTGKDGCKGKNDCKGKGGCKAEEPATKPSLL